MSVCISPRFALVVALGSLVGCSGGGAAVGSANFTCFGTDSRAICLQNCNLGCSETGCSRTDIAQNEIIILQFSADIDPVSVTPSSIRFRTAAGDQPVGEFFVHGNTVEFVPTLQVSGGQTFFGFAAGETYTMTLPGGDNQNAVVRSTSGKYFEKQLTCTLRSTLGIVDLNNVPPRATLIRPTQAQLSSAPRDTDIVLEFNELVDATPFLSGAASPVSFRVRRTRLTFDPNDGDARECDPASPPVALSGTPKLEYDAARSVSVLTFKPATILPGNVCIEIDVTSAVSDLSGRAAQPQQFSYLTEIVPLTDFPVTEEFDTTAFFDEDASAATWGGGQVSFARIGGDARHGTFDVSLGQDQGVVGGVRTYLFDTNNTIIPAANTTTGSPLAVTDGRFFFDKMVVPSDVRLRFTGTMPPVFTVAGRLDIQGEIDISGASVPTVVGTTATVGQPGGAGGIFGGAGGQGGAKSLGTPGQFLPPLSGSDGQAAQVLGGHGYAAAAAATGGRGSAMFPASGDSLDLIYPVPPSYLIAYTPSAAAGGGGGGMWLAGGQGSVISNSHNNPAAMGPPADGGAAMPFFPFPAPTGSPRSSLHFLVGGSGGGGAGSHACLTVHSFRRWTIGGGGGGGGGAIALRAGGSLRLGPLAKIIATGGSTPNQAGLTGTSLPGPGGGGSGGSIVLQSGGLVEIDGSLDVRGGTGGDWNRSATGSPSVVPNSAAVHLAGGSGSRGFVRLEAPGTPTTALLAGMQPPPVPQNVAPLVERDDLVGLRSTFYSTGLIFGPDFTRYEIHAIVDGAPVVFSDDPAVSNVPAQLGAPLRARFQAATLDVSSGQVLAIGPWRDSVRTAGPQVGIQSDGLNGFRFSILFDSTLAQTLTIEKVVVVYRN